MDLNLPTEEPVSPGRRFDDFGQTRKHIYDNVLTAASGIKPVEAAGRRIEISNVAYDPKDEDDGQNERFNLDAQARAVRERTTLGRRLRGTVRMIDTATGKTLEESRKLLAVVPRYNDDGTMIYRGARYNVVNQQRLKPGIYGRVKRNGETESHVNPQQGTGSMHRYIFNPETGVFYLNIRNSKVPLVPLLRTLGVQDDDIKQAWGEEIAAKNFSKKDQGSLDKLYERLVAKKDMQPDANKEFKQIAIRKAIDDIRLDRWTMKTLLDEDSDRLTPAAILKATAKTLAMSRGDQDADDRDHLAYQSVHGPEDFFAERINKDSGYMQRNAFRKALYRGKLQSLPTKSLQGQLEEVIFGSGVGVQPEYANPLDALSRATRVTKMGDGAIGSTSAAPMESRDFHASHQGFIDPAITTECAPGYVEVMTDEGWYRLDELQADSKVACLIEGRVEYHEPEKLQSYDFDGLLYGFKGKRIAYEVTGNHRMWVAPAHPGAKYRFETAEAIQGKHRMVLCGGHAPYRGELDSLKRMASPVHGQAGHQAFKLPKSFAIEDWAEFMGWFLSEGSTGGDSYRGGRNTVAISQVKSVNPENWERIHALLTRMGLRFCAAEGGFQLSGTHLASYCQVFGKSNEKYLPADVFEYPVEARRRLLEALLLGDGGSYQNLEKGKRIYATASLALAEDVQTLAFGLGYSVGYTCRPDNRKETYFDCHKVYLHTNTRRQIGRTKLSGGGQYRRPYVGKVYCATVPGGLMYWRIPGYSGFWIGNSLKVGLDLNFAAGAIKGKDGKLYTKLMNARTGKPEYVSTEKASKATIAFQGRDTEVPGYLLVNRHGQEDFAKPDEVDYIMPDASEAAFSDVSNLVPMKGYMPQNRLAMASRFLEQSLPLVNREAPLVQVAVPGSNKTESFQQRYAEKVGAVKSKSAGKVLEVTNAMILLDTPEGKRKISLHTSTPLGAKTSLINQPIVKPGDVVEPGQLLATSNFTDKDGTTAIGLNARMAFAPWGDNYEDTYTISESFAKRMASEHSYDFARDVEDNQRTKVSDFISAMPREYSKEQIGKLDKDGAIRVGEIVHRGDPVLLATGMRSPNQAKKLARSGGQRFSNASQIWEHEEPGVVTGVHKAKNGRTIVTVSGAFPLAEADKLGETSGTKGVVKIMPDDQMLQDKDGNPFDVVTSDLGVISRKNSSRAIAMALGKAAQARGKPYLLEEMEPDFDLAGFAQDELKKYGLSDTETVTDPTNGRKIHNIMTGPQFMMKLHHIAESKSHGRGVGAYSSDDSPARGSEEGMQAKRLSNQELSAMVAHGGFEYLREGALVRGQRNDEYWARFANGQDLPEPKVPLVYDKFIGYLKGMGVNPVRTGMKTRLMLLTDKDATELAGGRELKSAETVDMQRDLKPIPGGLFDKAIFGDDGKKFATYELSEAIPHPMMEDALRTLMSVTKKSYENIIKGEEKFGTYGTGPAAIGKWLSQLDATKELGIARRQAQDARKTRREAAVKRVRFLRGMVDRDIDPTTLMLKKIPIIPPAFRPVSKLEGKNVPLIDGMNLLYREMLNADENLKKVKGFAGTAPEEQLAVYDSVKAAMGLRQPLDPELRQKSVTGIMARLTGTSPKHSYVSRKLLSGTVDSVGRGVALPNADLGLDEIGIPEEQAWTMYKMPMLRYMRKRGVPLAGALEAIEKQSPMAVEALEAEMRARPVVASRAPVLHKFGNLAFMPRLMKGHSLQMNPLVHAGYNLDHDGDLQIGTVTIAVERSQHTLLKELIQLKQAEKPILENLAVKTKKGLGNDYVDTIVKETACQGSTSLTPYLTEIDMASFTKTQLPILQAAPKLQDHVVLHVDLSEFPVSESWRTSKGRCGDIHWHKPLVDIKVLAVHPVTGELNWVEVSDWTEHHGCEVEIITLSSKRQIFTDNDPRGLIVVRPGESLDLQPHKPYIAFKNRCLVPRIAKFVPTGPEIQSLDMTDLIAMGDEESRQHRLPNVLVAERTLDGDFGWFCGAMASDGWATNLNQVCLAKLHVPTRQNWERIVRTLLVGELKFYEYHREKGDAAVQNAYGATARINVTSKHLSCLTWEFFGDGAVDKHLPAFFMNAPEEFRAGILVALLDTDATVNVNTTKSKPQLTCWFNSCSLRLCREVVTLSMSLGVRGKVRWSKSTEIGTDAWVVEWSAADLQKLVRKYEHLMVNDERKDKILSTPVNDEMSGVGPAVRADSIPITYKLAATLRAKLGMPKDRSKVTREHSSMYTALQGAAKKGFISRYAATSIAAPLFDEAWLAKQHEWDKFVKWRERTEIVWDTIEDFERTGKVEVGYDLTVPGYENWMTAEGVIVPNTMNFHALITDEAIKEAKEKLLPSKSLISPKDFKAPMFVPRQDHALGIYLASTAKSDKPTTVFATKRDMLRAYERGEINIDTPVKVLEK